MGTSPCAGATSAAWPASRAGCGPLGSVEDGTIFVTLSDVSAVDNAASVSVVSGATAGDEGPSGVRSGRSCPRHWPALTANESLPISSAAACGCSWAATASIIGASIAEPTVILTSSSFAATAVGRAQTPVRATGSSCSGGDGGATGAYETLPTHAPAIIVPSAELLKAPA